MDKKENDRTSKENKCRKSSKMHRKIIAQQKQMKTLWSKNRMIAQQKKKKNADQNFLVQKKIKQNSTPPPQKKKKKQQQANKEKKARGIVVCLWRLTAWHNFSIYYHIKIPKCHELT